MSIQQEEQFFTNWINIKLLEDSLSPQTPTSTENPTLVDNLTTDLQDGLILIKLINRLIYEITSTPHNTHDDLCYLSPINKVPTLKLQKYENLIDFLKFVKIILHLSNSQDLVAEDIYDGHLKTILSLIWSIFLFYSSNLLPNNPNFSKIKDILLIWINERTKLNITNFNRDWENSYEILRMLILSYCQNVPKGSLTDLIDFIETTFAIPQLIHPLDFSIEHCLVVYLFELFKIFQVEKSYGDQLLDHELRQFIKTIVNLYNLKEVYEKDSQIMLAHIQKLIECLKNDNFETYKQFKLITKPEILFEDYPHIIQIYGSINTVLLDLGDFKFKPTIDINEISIKLNELITLDSIINEKYQLEDPLPPNHEMDDSITDIKITSDTYQSIKPKFLSETSSSFLTDLLDKQTLQSFCKLLPSSSPLSPNGSSFDLISTSSTSDDDNLFDDVGVMKSVNFKQFFDKLENGL